jgi:hypothetical protein
MKKPRSSQYLKREELAPLRDELEDMVSDYLQDAQIQNRAVKRSLDATSRQRLDFHKQQEEIQRTIRDIKCVLGLEDCPPHTSVLHEQHVSWSYFHVWIARINKRIDKIEKMLEEK